MSPFRGREIHSILELFVLSYYKGLLYPMLPTRIIIIIIIIMIQEDQAKTLRLLEPSVLVAQHFTKRVAE
jgi:hypothetical protein